MLLLQDLEASLAASMSREKDTMEQTATLEKEKENLARELASYINKEKDKVDLRYFYFDIYSLRVLQCVGLSLIQKMLKKFIQSKTSLALNICINLVFLYAANKTIS